MRKSVIVITVIGFLLGINAYAGNFVSGSTGTDGAFAPISDITVQLPENGIFNFTTVNIPAGVTVKFQRNVTNTPVYILATGDVNIAGTIDVSGESGMNGNTGSTGPIYGGKGGPGGFDGGYGGEPASTGVIAKASGTGLGPGGSMGGNNACIMSYNDSRGCVVHLLSGQAGSYSSQGVFTYNTQMVSQTFGTGNIYGTSNVQPLIGGSGGGGGSYGSSLNQYGGSGGGGGGAILIASSGMINITGNIKANGGVGGYGEGYESYTGYSSWASRNLGGGGSGGAIKLIANNLIISGLLSAMGNNNGYSQSSNGRIRLETHNLSLSGSISPSPSVSTPSFVFLPQVPTLLITKIAGNTVPVSASGSYTTPDIILPTNTTNPISVEISASNIPVGTNIMLKAVPQNGSSSSATAVLAGTDAASTATTSISISTTSPSVITAETTFTIQTAMYYDGEEINKVRVASKVGKESEVVYITKSGKEITYEKLFAGLK